MPVVVILLAKRQLVYVSVRERYIRAHRSHTYIAMEKLSHNGGTTDKARPDC